MAASWSPEWKRGLRGAKLFYARKTPLRGAHYVPDIIVCKRDAPGGNGRPLPSVPA